MTSELVFFGTLRFREVHGQQGGVAPVWAGGPAFKGCRLCSHSALLPRTLSLLGRAVCSLPLEYITAKNHIVCKYLLSSSFTTNPRQTACGRPSRLLPQDAWLGRVTPSLLLAPTEPYLYPSPDITSSRPKLQLHTCSFRRGGGLPWPGATDVCHRTSIDWVNRCVSYVTKFIFWDIFCILSAQFETVSTLRTRTKPFTYFIFSRILSPGPEDTVGSIIYDWVRIKC